ncbi:MAG: hypothetical protein F4Y45_07345 [Acidobacteria bacterium]|nr:hypothetical protein [Acidobacteriota bacterium]MXZ70418.1 hypothetical protein [Acidobacteriota bacterium]MYD70786.1 hypothetical protein [Acidobacteriota bacterium]MYJ06315.1 hypothetical protein [Acidobacteriota bacterium]
MPDTAPPPVSIRKLALAALASLVAAGLVFVGAVLPAEYGVDPLGTGEIFGLLALAQVVAVTSEEGEYRLDTVELPLAPGEWVEYTYRLEEGAAMLYTWQATGAVEYNLHSAPDGAPPGYAESFDSAASDAATGSYIAPFTGIHGWYWENPGTSEVMITMHTAGFYRDAHVVRARADGYRTLTDVRGNPVE